MNRTLVVMAAGMGSRFGGLKQIEPMGPNQEFLIDYSIYDAIDAGFNKVVFIIKEENYEIFKETIGSRIEDKIKVEYAFQKMETVPEGSPILKDREKPLGTAHAIYCVKDIVKEPFCIINADDFYGREAYFEAIHFFDENKDENIYGLVGYQTAKTLSKNGSAKRGVCKLYNNNLETIIESKVEEKEGKIIAEPLDGSTPFEISGDTIVSMNMLLFYPNLFPYLEEKLRVFLERPKEKLEKDEFLIPDVLKEAMEEGVRKVKVIETTASWYGVTYKEDKEEVVNAIKEMTEKEIYPSPLWME